MRIARSLLSKLLAGIIFVFSLGFLMRRMSEASSGPTPERLSTAPAGERQTPYALILPRHGEPLRPGWNRPAPEKIPRPTYWPLVFGLGTAFFFWGLISNIFVLLLGFTLLVVALAGWVIELLVEFRD